ncbi:MAG TPA: hypothetical protein VFT16_03525 [Candidatus Saccharimonadales bacterium]|nr:hypothetical protein [Candidatus Saccharimonadales bacterium]
MEYERFNIASESIPELGELTAATDLLWSAAQGAAPNQYPGFEVTHDGDTAAFTMHHSPTMHDRVALYRGSDGVWCIEERRQRAALEDEGFAQLVRITAISPLSLGAKPTRIIERTNPASAGEFIIESWGESSRGLDAEGCERLRDTLRVIRGERLDHQGPPHMTRVRGWLAKIGAVFR